MKLASGEQVREAQVSAGGIVLDGTRIEFEAVGGPGADQVLTIGGTRHRVRSARRGDRAYVWCDGRVFEFALSAGGARARPAADHGGLLAPMPGRVRKMLVSAGDRVERGQVLLILEAMKMEHSIRAPREGVVRALAYGEGDLVEAGAVLAELE